MLFFLLPAALGVAAPHVPVFSTGGGRKLCSRRAKKWSCWRSDTQDGRGGVRHSVDFALRPGEAAGEPVAQRGTMWNVWFHAQRAIRTSHRRREGRRKRSAFTTQTDAPPQVWHIISFMALLDCMKILFYHFNQIVTLQLTYLFINQKIITITKQKSTNSFLVTRKGEQKEENWLILPLLLNWSIHWWL